jgi:glycosyltransferase involved in cell wall biosynthesis
LSLASFTKIDRANFTLNLRGIMLISVCIPTYNRPDLIHYAIDSVKAQTYRPIEIVVSDDSPSDDTELALSESIRSGEIRYCRNLRSLGQAENVNRLFDLARGELLVLLHDDDILLPNAVTELAECFAANPGITAAYGKQYLMGSDGSIDEAASEGLNAAYHRTIERAGCQTSPIVAGLTAQFPNDGYLVRTAVARMVRYRPDSTVGGACDYDFALRLAVAADRFYFLNKYTAGYRLTEQSVSTGNNYTNLAFDLLTNIELPSEVEEHRQQQMQNFARPAVTQWLATGNRKSALRVFLSSAYGWQHRISALGLLHILLMLCPAGLTQVLFKQIRAARLS